MGCTGIEEKRGMNENKGMLGVVPGEGVAVSAIFF